MVLQISAKLQHEVHGHVFCSFAFFKFDTHVCMSYDIKWSEYEVKYHLIMSFNKTDLMMFY